MENKKPKEEQLELTTINSVSFTHKYIDDKGVIYTQEVYSYDIDGITMLKTILDSLSYSLTKDDEVKVLGKGYEGVFYTNKGMVKLKDGLFYIDYNDDFNTLVDKGFQHNFKEAVENYNIEHEEWLKGLDNKI